MRALLAYAASELTDAPPAEVDASAGEDTAAPRSAGP